MPANDEGFWWRWPEGGKPETLLLGFPLPGRPMTGAFCRLCEAGVYLVPENGQPRADCTALTHEDLARLGLVPEDRVSFVPSGTHLRTHLVRDRGWHSTEKLYPSWLAEISDLCSYLPESLRNYVIGEAARDVEFRGMMLWLLKKEPSEHSVREMLAKQEEALRHGDSTLSEGGPA